MRLRTGAAIAAAAAAGLGRGPTDAAMAADILRGAGAAGTGEAGATGVSPLVSSCLPEPLPFP